MDHATTAMRSRVRNTSLPPQKWMTGEDSLTVRGLPSGKLPKKPF